MDPEEEEECSELAMAGGGSPHSQLILGCSTLGAWEPPKGSHHPICSSSRAFEEGRRTDRPFTLASTHSWHHTQVNQTLREELEHMSSQEINHLSAKHRLHA